MSGGLVGPAHQLAALPVERAEHGRNCRHHGDHEVSGAGDGVGNRVPSGAEAVAEEGEAAISHPGAEEGEDPVSPAVRSASARAKAASRHQAYGRELRPAQQLLDHLATLTRNTCSVPRDRRHLRTHGGAHLDSAKGVRAHRGTDPAPPKVVGTRTPFRRKCPVQPG